MDRSALAISKQSGNEGSAATNVANSGTSKGKKTSEKDSLWKKALAKKWSSTRRKLTTSNDSFSSWKNLRDIVILLRQGLLIGKVIGHAREEGGLFLLQAQSGTTCPTPHTYLS
ncbi:hypothetical protein CK203_068378 [Vitis vinifera]|uniref:Uncharacterized protein n=1 Tax=Vitis vinifera TaxID=29760 RepID=A0A438F316_VITVI|nr:hypothetical protein CK203_068378 [Vitis vinifera]